MFRRKMRMPLYDELTTFYSSTMYNVSSSEGTVPLVTAEGVDEFAELEAAWKTVGFKF